jgi:hypothetical protein
VEGRIEAVMNALPSDSELIESEPATVEQIVLAHTMDHIEYVRLRLERQDEKGPKGGMVYWEL